MPTWLKTYLEMWVAVLPVIGLATLAGFLIVGMANVWLAITIFVVCLHICVGWIWLVVRFSERWNP